MWSALDKAVEKDSSLSNTVMRVECHSDAWTLLNCIVDSDYSSTARDNSKEFEPLAMIIGESAREFIP